MIDGPALQQNKTQLQIESELLDVNAAGLSCLRRPLPSCLTSKPCPTASVNARCASPRPLACARSHLAPLAGWRMAGTTLASAAGFAGGAGLVMALFGALLLAVAHDRFWLLSGASPAFYVAGARHGWDSMP